MPFATVTSVSASPPVPSSRVEAAEMRRYVETRRERHSENASILREMSDTGWQDRVRKSLTGGREAATNGGPARD